MLNYEEEVKRIFPKAWCESKPEFYSFVINADKERYLSPRLNKLGDPTPLHAWKSAYEKITETKCV